MSGATDLFWLLTPAIWLFPEWCGSPSSHWASLSHFSKLLL